MKEADSEIPVSPKDINNTEIIVGEVFVRVSSQLNLEFFQRVAKLGLPFIHQIGEAEIVVSTWETRIKSDGLPELFYRFRQET